MNWILDILAAYRLTRLVTTDDVTAPIRDPLVEQLQSGGHDKLAELFGCPYCVSVWVGFGIMLVARRLPGWLLIRDALALSGGASLLAAADRKLDD